MNYAWNCDLKPKRKSLIGSVHLTLLQLPLERVTHPQGSFIMALASATAPSSVMMAIVSTALSRWGFHLRHMQVCHRADTSVSHKFFLAW